MRALDVKLQVTPNNSTSTNSCWYMPTAVTTCTISLSPFDARVGDASEVSGWQVAMAQNQHDSIY